MYLLPQAISPDAFSRFHLQKEDFCCRIYDRKALSKGESMLHEWIFAAFAVAVGATALTLATTYITYRMAFYNKRKETFDPFFSPERLKDYPFRDRSNKLISALLAEPYEEVEITASDGKRLAGRYYHRRDGAPLDIMFHGYMSGALHDFPGPALEILNTGHNLLLVDQRGHGKSHGKTVSFGIKERFDCLDWTKYAVQRFGDDVQIVIIGNSMGAATVLYASELELPAQVRGIVADCPFSSAEQVIKKSATKMGYPTRLAFSLARLGGRIYDGFDVCERTTIEAVRGAKLPLLLFHGVEDKLVPYEMSLELAEAYGGEVRLEIFEGATHGTSYLVDTPRYVSALHEFYEKILK